MTQGQSLRTAVGIAFIWGIVWAATAMIVGTTIEVIDPAQIDSGEAAIELAPLIGLVGLVCGLVFAGLASVPGREERIVDLSPTRVVQCGIVVSALVPLLTGKILPEVLVVAPLGALSALLSVAIMRRLCALRPAA